MKAVKKLMLVALFAFAFIGLNCTDGFCADSVLTPVDYTFGNTYSGQLDNRTLNSGETFAKSFRVTLTDRQHVYIIANTQHKNLTVDIYDSDGNCVSSDSNSKKTNNDLKTKFTTKHSADLKKGIYQIIVRQKSYLNYGHDPFDFEAYSEPIITLQTASIKGVSKLNWGSIKVNISPLNNALGYETQVSSNVEFSNPKKIQSPEQTVNFSGLPRINYVRTRAYAAYSDGIKVYGSWSQTKSIVFPKLTNTMSVKAKTASVKFNKIRRKTQTLVVSKVINFKKKGQGAKTYSKVSGNKRITIDKKTGKLTIKKGLKKGTYKVKVKVKADGNTKYKAATKTVTFKIKVK